MMASCVSTVPESLLIYHVNIRSFNKNHYLLKMDIHKYSPDIILLNETSSTHSSPKLRDYYCYHICKEAFSGVAMFIKYNILFSIIPLNSSDTIAVKIHTSLGPLIISTTYSPPRHSYIDTRPLHYLLNFNIPVILIGDFNAKNYLFNNCPYPPTSTAKTKGKQLELLITNRNLSYLGPSFPTFQTGRGTGKPDHIIVNNKFSIFHYSIEPGQYVGSDHIPIHFKISSKPLKIARPCLHYSNLSISNFQRELEAHTFSSLHNSPVSSIDTTTTEIIDNISQALTNNCPKFIINCYQSYKLTPELIRKLDQLRTAYRSYLYLGYPSIATINNFKQDLIDDAAIYSSDNWKKVVHLASDCHSNPSKFWKKIKYLSGKSSPMHSHLIRSQLISDPTHPNFGDVQNCNIIDHQDKADYMSSTWKDVFRPHEDITNNHTENVEEWFASNPDLFQHSDIVNLDALNPTHPIFHPISISDIQNCLKSFNKHKAPGPSKLRYYVIQFLPRNYFQAVCMLYNSIIASKYWPIIFKTSMMIFLPKPGKSPTNPLHYRPISLLESLAKLLEKILTKRILLYLEHNNLLPSFQFGFRPGLSTNLSIYLFQEILQEFRKQGKATLIATRDVCKAFDTVWHEGLLYKIRILLGLDDPFLALIYNYLTNRIVLPKFDHKSGPSFTPTAGVPQGSCLGPILYLIYVADIPQPSSRQSILLQFADDVVHITASDSSRRNKNQQAARKLTRDLTTILEWEQNWKIKSNPEKSVIYYSSQVAPSITINNQILPTQIAGTFLGYHFSRSRSIKDHCQFIKQKFQSNFIPLYRFNHAPPKIKRHLYLTLIRPILTYPSLLLSQLPKTHISTLQRLQNKAVRFITGTSLRDRLSSQYLHELANIPALNIHLFQISTKAFYKLKDMLRPDNHSDRYSKLLSDFDYTTDPIKQRVITPFQFARDFIFDPDTNRSLKIDSLPDNIDDITHPLPMFK